eukprot:CAMPEP_0184862846 /NCGR_PEP_ID=MMETSP0580-20130426/8107_1 /TAXON_ID=1118495 /ORGANISM="Dactyliosolen fragilissimus" /LENGTH=290 /DNA_ID=CAMNT_0027360855 /DNA_START=63 /DNA_END=935 /DNA_ORIENTATION=-
MGQTASKQFFSKISKSIEKHQTYMVKDALSEIARKQNKARATGSKYSDPNALQGFKREGGALDKEYKQVKFLKETSSKDQNELPEDLIQFLNDAGPISKQLDKNLTSPKIYDSLRKEDEERSKQNQERNLRRKRIMPLVNRLDNQEQTLGEEIDNDVLTTSRTTNFSESSPKLSPTKLSLHHSEIFDLLKDVQLEGVENRDEYKDFTTKCLQSKYCTKNLSATMTKKQQEENFNALLNTLLFSGIPILMEDNENSLFAVLPHLVNKVRVSGLKVVDAKAETSLKLKNIDS